MSKSKTILDLERNADKVQKREWLAERTSWVACCGILVCAVAGLLGPGWLSAFQQISSNGSFNVSGYSINRHEAPTELIIQINEATEGDTFILAISRSFLDGVEIKEIMPAPVRMHDGEEEIEFQFSTTGPASQKSVLLRYQGQSWGWLNCGLRYGKSSITQTILVLP